jgi:5-methylcytosine-specific restriction protein A
MRHPENPSEWYGLNKWRLRAKAQMREHPLCVRCLETGLVKRAVIADHVEPHKGNWNQFWLGALQSLCRQCHESSKKFQEVRGYRNDIGADGYPLDKAHPFWKGT